MINCKVLKCKFNNNNNCSKAFIDINENGFCISKRRLNKVKEV